MTDTRTTAEKLAAEKETAMRAASEYARGYLAGMAKMHELDEQRAPVAERVRTLVTAVIVLLESLKVPAASAASTILRELLADL